MNYSLQKAISVSLASLMFVVALFFGSGKDTDDRYVETVNGISAYSNTMEEAIPQTELHSYIDSFFRSALPEGKTEKKAIVIGYDGCRADMLQYLNNGHESGINMLLAEENKSCFLTYCGGVNYPYINTQPTSTAPGWCSILTGVWAKQNGAVSNYVVKNDDYRTLFATLTADGTVDSAAFYVSWDGHFTSALATYTEEKAYCEKNALNVIFSDADDDAGTEQNVLNDLQKQNCSDFIFTIIEAPDHAGHGKVFSPYNEEYVQGFYDAEQIGAHIISAVKSRPTYSTEDWLIIITADHGGRGPLHGLTSIMERMTFVVCNRNLSAD